MRMLNCQIFPLVLLLVTDEKEYARLTKKSTCTYEYPTWGTACTISFSGDTKVSNIVMVALGDTSDMDKEEVDSTLTHEAVHVKQFLFESIGEQYPGVETEAYTVQYFADYLIKEYNYRLNKQPKDKSNGS